MTTYDNTPTVVVGLIPVYTGERVGTGLAMIARPRGEGEVYPRMALPGGFQERPESLKEACVREIKEEIGIDLSVDKLRLIDAVTTPDGFTNLVFFEHEPIPFKEYKTTIDPTEVEASYLMFVPVKSVFPLHTDQINAFFERHSKKVVDTSS